LLTEKASTARGLIPVAPIRRLIEQWSANETDARALLGPKGGNCLGNTAKVAHLTGLNQELIKSIRQGKREWIEFDAADRIVITLSISGADGWRLDPELRAIYQAFDFTALDERRPTTREAA
jgi:hypothetical protein